MQTCRDAIDVLRAFVDGDLDPSDRAQLQAHLDSCSPCVEFLESYRKTPGLCREALKAKMPDALADRLNAFLRKHTT